MNTNSGRVELRESGYFASALIAASCSSIDCTLGRSAMVAPT